MRIGHVLALCAMLGLADGAFAYSPPRYVQKHWSWGKAGVSFADYRADAIGCAKQAALLDVSETGAAKTLQVATRRFENVTNGAAEDYGDVLRQARPEHQFEEVGTLQYGVLDRCLADHGYQRFRLTGAQRHRIAALPAGSDARRQYLYSLASDSALLARQADPLPAGAAAFSAQ